MPMGKIFRVTTTRNKSNVNHKNPKRSYLRRRNRHQRYNKNRLMNLTLNVLPHMKFTKQRYAENTQLYVNNAFSDQLCFSMNSLYDPNKFGGSGVGINHQFYLFDQMNALYNKYTVLGSKITLIIRPVSTANTYPTNVYGEVTELTSLSYPGSIAWEKPGVKIATFNSSASNVYVPQKKMVFNWSAKKWFRTKSRNGIISNANYSGTGSSSPNTEALFYLTAMAQQQNQTTFLFAVDVIIDSIVAWTEPKQPNQS